MPSSARAEEKRSRNAAAKVVNRFMSIWIDLKVLDLVSDEKVGTLERTSPQAARSQRATAGSGFQSVDPTSSSMHFNLGS